MKIELNLTKRQIEILRSIVNTYPLYPDEPETSRRNQLLKRTIEKVGEQL